MARPAWTASTRTSARPLFRSLTRNVSSRPRNGLSSAGRISGFWDSNLTTQRMTIAARAAGIRIQRAFFRNFFIGLELSLWRSKRLRRTRHYSTRPRSCQENAGPSIFSLINGRQPLH